MQELAQLATTKLVEPLEAMVPAFAAPIEPATLAASAVLVEIAAAENPEKAPLRGACHAFGSCCLILYASPERRFPASELHLSIQSTASAHGPLDFLPV